ncbi:MAG: hypothetical protein ACKPKO_47470, partial [Candidatus Fonsibacter sp.]
MVTFDVSEETRYGRKAQNVTVLRGGLCTAAPGPTSVPQALIIDNNDLQASGPQTRTTSVTSCRYGVLCWRPQCKFYHNRPRQRASRLAEFWLAAAGGPCSDADVSSPSGSGKRPPPGAGAARPCQSPPAGRDLHQQWVRDAVGDCTRHLELKIDSFLDSTAPLERRPGTLTGSTGIDGHTGPFCDCIKYVIHAGFLHGTGTIAELAGIAGHTGSFFWIAVGYHVCTNFVICTGFRYASGSFNGFTGTAGHTGPFCVRINFVIH